MANKEGLRRLREKTIINITSKQQEKVLLQAVMETADIISDRFGVELKWEERWYLHDIVDQLEKSFPDVDFCDPQPSSSMKPDGGILSILGKDGKRDPILIAERKNQGTNDLRKAEGKRRQAQGNAVERLGKNVIGFKTALISEGIFPFVCFGDGCDFEDGSSILDRVVTISMFGHLRKTYLLPQGPAQEFLRGSYYFQASSWKKEAIKRVLEDVAIRSVQYYFAKYGERSFIEPS